MILFHHRAFECDAASGLQPQLSTTNYQPNGIRCWNRTSLCGSANRNYGKIARHSAARS